MSNVALFNQQLPDYLKEVELDDVTRALTGGGTGVKRIALGNNKFILKVMVLKFLRAAVTKWKLLLLTLLPTYPVHFMLKHGTPNLKLLHLIAGLMMASALTLLLKNLKIICAQTALKI